MKTKCLFVVALTCTVLLAGAYPISPRPLRLLVEESEFIVFAHVSDIREIKAKKNKEIDEETVAVLKIYEVIQGKITDTEIQVPYPANYICPAPPRFVKGTDALVFLSKWRGSFSVHALSYGVKTMSKADEEIYKARIIEIQDILKETDIDRKFIRTTEWLVKCAESPVTRHEGTYELSRGSDFMSFYDRTEEKPFQYALSEDQKQRLKNALLATTELSYSELGLIDLVYSSNGQEIFRLMLERMKSMGDKQVWYAGEYMKRLNLYKSSPRSLELANTFEEKSFASNTTPTELDQIVHEFINELEKLP